MTNIAIEIARYIEDNLDKPIPLYDISARLSYNKFHLNRLFTEQTGLTIYQCIRQRRLSLAAFALTETDKPITEIAFDAGYQS